MPKQSCVVLTWQVFFFSPLLSLSAYNLIYPFFSIFLLWWVATLNESWFLTIFDFVCQPVYIDEFKALSKMQNDYPCPLPIPWKKRAYSCSKSSSHYPPFSTFLMSIFILPSFHIKVCSNSLNLLSKVLLSFKNKNHFPPSPDRDSE